MKISVVTPSYNQGRFIGRCIESVKNQEGDFAIEHIILDNCSADETNEILDAYNRNPGRVEVTCIIEKDAGQTAAINKGFKLATGDVVCWLNTDEWYATNALTDIQNFFNTHPVIDVLFGNMTFVDESGNTLKEKKESGFYKGMLLYYGCYIPSCATFVRRRVIDAEILLDESYRVCMDFEWYANLCKRGYVFKHLNKRIAFFTRHESNISLVTSPRLRYYDFNRVRLLYGGFNFLPDKVRLLMFDLFKYYWMTFRFLTRISRVTF